MIRTVRHMQETNHPAERNAPTAWAKLLAAVLLCGATGAVQAQLVGSPDEHPAMVDPIDKGEQPIVHLNPDDPGYDAWRVVREDLSEGREPGPINVQRYKGGFPWIGIPTFFHLPVALTPEDLKAGEVDVAIMGAELVGGMRARTWGPMEMRNPHRSEIYHLWGEWAMPELDSGLAWERELRVVDYGDAPMEPLSLERTIPEVRKLVRQIAGVKLKNGKQTVPIIVGGAHALMYPDYAALADVYGKDKIGVIHFDAHQDYAPTGFGHIHTHGNPVRALLLEGFLEGDKFVQVGLRGPTSTDVPTLKEARAAGIRYHTMAEVEKRGWEAVMEDALKEVREQADYLFISFDVDVIDPTFMPGTATPEPGGLYIREVLPMMRRLCAENDIVGVEIVELKPDADVGYTSVQNAKAVLRQCLNGMAMRKKGLTEPGYLHPVMVDDGH